MRCRCIVALVVLSGLCFAPRAALAQVKPFSVTGAGRTSHLPFPGDAAEHWSAGVATHLGAYQQQGAFVAPISLTPLAPDQYYAHQYGTVVAVGTFESASPAVFEGASGAALTFDYGKQSPGIVELILVGQDENGPIFTTEWDAIFTLVEGTGRLHKAMAGEFRMIAVSDLFGPEAFLPNHDWETPGIAYSWSSMRGGYVTFEK